MIALLALTLQVAGVLRPPTGPVHDGRRRQLDVVPPRIVADVRIDALLDEAPWQQAARLVGFSQFSPADGGAATDSTEVLVWYSPTAIHFGVRAFAPAGTVNATLADRDRIGSDDHVQILLGTFDDGRQALVFGVNPLGVQMDGTLLETGSTGGGFSNTGGGGREAPDLSADFVFESKGRVTDAGYDVEIRIPFKSLRYQPGQVQRWGINVVRRVQRTGVEDSWAPARRGAASFLGQSGHLTGLTDLRRGLVLDLNPVVTQRTNGVQARGAPARWDYSAREAELGGNVRWGITNNLTLSATVRPDFSQVEADAAQVQFDPRSALFFAERRPFFLEGIEQFTVPSGLIYTRQIVQPAVALKLTGKVAGTNVAVLSAIDDNPSPGPGRAEHARFNILRVQRDVGAQSRVGVVYTDRVDGGDVNRVAGADARIVFGQVYSAQAQLVGSATRRGDAGTVTAPLWNAQVARNGRRVGFRYSASAIDDQFEAGSGFISRIGVARVSANHRLTLFGRPDAFVRSYGGDIEINGTWQYQAFVTGRDAQDKKLHFNTNAQLRGGWSAGASLFLETFGYDRLLYEDYAVAVPRAGGVGVDTAAYVGTPRLPNRDYVLSVNTPEFKTFSGNVFAIWGQDENFYEWSSSDILFLTLGLNVRPTEKLRANFAYQLQQFDRVTDGSTVARRQIPRLRLEYQLSRPVFIRLVGQYVSQQQDSLRDDSRTNAPVLVRNSAGTYVRAGATESNVFRGDVLFSYQPTPGTVFFAGYGSTLTEPDALRFGELRRASDGFFVKLSYLFRI
jgi:hypothetical protein